MLAPTIREQGFRTDYDQQIASLYIYKDTYRYGTELHMEGQVLVFVIPTVKTSYYDLNHPDSIDQFLSELQILDRTLST